MGLIKNNILIAKFMNMETTEQYIVPTSIKETRYHWENDTGYSKEELEFNNSWDWLMPVVDKIENLGFQVWIIKHKCIINKFPKEIITIEKNNKIDAVYQSIIKLIKWHNKEK